MYRFSKFQIIGCQNGSQSEKGDTLWPPWSSGHALYPCKQEAKSNFKQSLSNSSEFPYNSFLKSNLIPIPKCSFCTQFSLIDSIFLTQRKTSSVYIKMHCLKVRFSSLTPMDLEVLFPVRIHKWYSLLHFSLVTFQGQKIPLN